jgi:hypothetical protein
MPVTIACSSNSPGAAGPNSMNAVESSAPDDAGTVEVEFCGVGPAESIDAGLDSSVGTGDPLDGGSEGGTVQCNFPGAPQSLTCTNGDYCMAFAGGAIGSGTAYSCVPLPEACMSDRSCACVCSTASSNSASQCAVRGQQCICIVSQGILTLLCAAP